MNIDLDVFLKEYWQKKPLLIKQAYDGFQDPLDAEELAGLACEPFCDARLVREKGGAYPWQVTYGPFAESTLSSLPESHWTLLVRHVDKIIPQLADLKDEFHFAPDWRKEDVMVSFAPRGGTVGAHIDRYDVFLLQGMGKRQWDISLHPLEEEVLEDHQDIRILKDFTPDESYILEPGDMLYIPPRYVHAGISLEDSLTYSIGFRAPTAEELCAGYWAAQAECQQDAERFLPLTNGPIHPAELSDNFQTRIYSFVQQQTIDPDVFSDWLSKKMSEPDHGYEVEANPQRTFDTFSMLVREGKQLRRNEAVRFLYQKRDDVYCYIGGKQKVQTAALLPLVAGVCRAHAIDSAMLQECLTIEGALPFLYDLYQEGIIYFVEDMDWQEHDSEEDGELDDEGLDLPYRDEEE